MVILWCYSKIYSVKGKSSSTSNAYVKTFVFLNTTEELINLFEIRYMIKPTLHVQKVVRDQVEKFLK